MCYTISTDSVISFPKYNYTITVQYYLSSLDPSGVTGVRNTPSESQFLCNLAPSLRTHNQLLKMSPVYENVHVDFNETSRRSFNRLSHFCTQTNIESDLVFPSGSL